MVILLKLIKFIAAATERFMPQSSSSIPGSHTPGPCILGIDNGLTVTKAVVFDAGGRALAMARRSPLRMRSTVPGTSASGMRATGARVFSSVFIIRLISGKPGERNG